MADRYISKEWMLKTLNDYKRTEVWNNDVCDADTVQRVLRVVENLVNDAPALGQRRLGNQMLEVKNAALRFQCESLERQIADERASYSQAESLNQMLAMWFYKGMVTANEQTLDWLERMVKDG